MLERTEYNHKERRVLFREALDKGKSKGEIKDEDVRKYVENKERNSKVKLYKDYVFIYSKNRKQLYTMYRIPKYLVGKEEDRDG